MINAANLEIILKSYRDSVAYFNLRQEEAVNTVKCIVLPGPVTADLRDYALELWPPRLERGMSLSALGNWMEKFLRFYIASGRDGMPRKVLDGDFLCSSMDEELSSWMLVVVGEDDDVVKQLGCLHTIFLNEFPFVKVMGKVAYPECHYFKTEDQ